jgi:hypothetical protein
MSLPPVTLDRDDINDVRLLDEALEDDDNTSVASSDAEDGPETLQTSDIKRHCCRRKDLKYWCSQSRL